MFRNIFEGFGEDPFFSGQEERMQGIAGSLGNPFGGLRPLALDNPDHRQDRRERQQQRHPDTRDIAPRDMFGGMFGDMQSMFNRMERNFEAMANNPDAYSYSSSTMMSYSKEGRGDPRYFQASKSTRQAPGGIKETQHSVQDSDTGIHRMAIGHHLGDRARVMERSLNKKTNQEDRHENLFNLNESEGDAFNREWQHKTKHTARSLRHRDDHGSTQEMRPKHSNRLADRAHESRTVRNARNEDYDVRDTRRVEGDRVRERKVRMNSRPTNKHSPRGGL